MWQSIGLTLLVIVATLACVLLFMLCGLLEFLEGISSAVCECCGQYAELGALKTDKQTKTTRGKSNYAIICDKRLVRFTLKNHPGTLVTGWYVVWQLFLSKFKFLRELIGDTGSQQGDNEPSETETEQETPPSPQRGRQKSARQRRAATGETT